MSSSLSETLSEDNICHEEAPPIIFFLFFRDLVDSFLKTMEETGADFTNSFRCLSRVPLPSSSDFTEKLSTVKNYLLSQCCTADEVKKANSPRIDPRSVQIMVGYTTYFAFLSLFILFIYLLRNFSRTYIHTYIHTSYYSSLNRYIIYIHIYETRIRRRLGL